MKMKINSKAISVLWFCQILLTLTFFICRSSAFIKDTEDWFKEKFPWMNDIKKDLRRYYYLGYGDFPQSNISTHLKLDYMNTSLSFTSRIRAFEFYLGDSFFSLIKNNTISSTIFHLGVPVPFIFLASMVYKHYQEYKKDLIESEDLYLVKKEELKYLLHQIKDDSSTKLFHQAIVFLKDMPVPSPPPTLPTPPPTDTLHRRKVHTTMSIVSNFMKPILKMGTSWFLILFFLAFQHFLVQSTSLSNDMVGGYILKHINIMVNLIYPLHYILCMVMSNIVADNLVPDLFVKNDFYSSFLLGCKYVLIRRAVRWTPLILTFLEIDQGWIYVLFLIFSLALVIMEYNKDPVLNSYIMNIWESLKEIQANYAAPVLMAIFFGFLLNSFNDWKNDQSYVKRLWNRFVNYYQSRPSLMSLTFYDIISSIPNLYHWLMWLFAEDFILYVIFAFCDYTPSLNIENAQLSLPAILTSSESSFLLPIILADFHKYYHELKISNSSALPGCVTNANNENAYPCHFHSTYNDRLSSVDPSKRPVGLFSASVLDGVNVEESHVLDYPELKVGDYVILKSRTVGIIYAIVRYLPVLPFLMIGYSVYSFYYRWWYHNAVPEDQLIKWMKEQSTQISTRQSNDKDIGSILANLRTNIKWYNKYFNDVPITYSSFFSEEVIWPTLKPIFIGFIGWLFQFLIAGLTLTYMFNMDDREAIKYLHQSMFAFDYFWTYMLGFAFANSFYYYRPKSYFWMSLLWSLAYYMIRRYMRNFREFNSWHVEYFPSSLSCLIMAIFFSWIYAGGGPSMFIRYIIQKFFSESAATTLFLAAENFFDDSVKMSLYFVTAILLYLFLPYEENTQDYKRKPGDLEFCKTSIGQIIERLWNFLRFDFTYTTTFTIMGWDSIFSFLEAFGLFPSLRASAEAMRYLIERVGFYSTTLACKKDYRC